MCSYFFARRKTSIRWSKSRERRERILSTNNSHKSLFLHFPCAWQCAIVAESIQWYPGGPGSNFQCCWYKLEFTNIFFYFKYFLLNTNDYQVGFVPLVDFVYFQLLAFICVLMFLSTVNFSFFGLEFFYFVVVRLLFWRCFCYFLSCYRLIGIQRWSIEIWKVELQLNSRTENYKWQWHILR